MSERNEELYRLAKDGLNAATSDEQRRHFFKLAEAVLREHAPPEPRKLASSAERAALAVCERYRERAFGTGTSTTDVVGSDIANAFEMFADEFARITATEVMETE